MGSVKSILPTDFPSLGVPWLMEAATALYGKASVADRMPQVANRRHLQRAGAAGAAVSWPARAC